LDRIIEETKAQNILELGVGTGTIAVGLAQKGLKMTGVDHSPEMLKQAGEKAKRYGVKLKLVEGDIVDMRLEQQFDMILCLGNTLPLIRSLAKSRQLFANCRRHLRPGGSLIFQMLNYDRILKTKPSTFATDISENTVRIKQYRYLSDHIEFIVSIVDSTTIPPSLTVSRNKIRPWIRKELTRELGDVGFGAIKAYGDYNKSKFNLGAKDLIIICNRR